MSYRNPKFDREFEFSRRLLTVETGARASDIKRLAWSFDQALSFWRLLSRYERDSRSTLNGSGAKKLIIVPSTMARHHMPIRVRPDTAFNLVLRKTFSSFAKSIPAVTDVPAATRATNMLNARNVLIFVVFVARAHLATDTFYSASSFCNARNEFTPTARAVAKHLRGNVRKFVS